MSHNINIDAIAQPNIVNNSAACVTMKIITDYDYTYNVINYNY